MDKIIHYDPVTQETWIPSSGIKPPYWARETLESKRYWHRQNLLDELLGNKIKYPNLDAGYFYCPYVPTIETPVVLDPTSYSVNKGIMTRYGKKLLEQGQKYYGKIQIQSSENQQSS